MKNRNIVAEIHDPCTVDLSSVRKTGCGTHCAICEIKVYDFTKKTTSEVVDIMNQQNIICGEFHQRHISPSKSSHRFLNQLDNFFTKIRLPKLTIAFIGFAMFFSSCRQHVMGTYVKTPEGDKSDHCDNVKKGKFSSPNH